MHRLLLRLYGLVLSAFFGVTFTTQILAFLGGYTPVLVIPMSLLMTGLAYWGYQRIGRKWHAALEQPAQRWHSLARAAVVSVVLLLSIVFLYRMALWPFSELGAQIPADFRGYHAAKALHLPYSGSFWNLNLPYGQYPIGYEGLLAFAVLLTGHLESLGLVHLSITLLLFLTLYVLLSRYTPFAPPYALLLSLGIFFIPSFYSQILVVGKNDVLLSTTVLVAIAHAPVGDEKRAWHPLGLAYATLLSLATKATGLYVLFYLWGLVLLFWFLAWRRGTSREYLRISTFALLLALMFPGGLWVIRNVLVMGSLFSPEVSLFFQTSIANNLTNPLLLNAGAESNDLLKALLVVIASSAGLLFSKRFRWDMLGLIGVLVLSFILTPLSAFHTLDSTTLHVEWRYTLHGLWMLLVLVLALLAPPLHALMEYIERTALLRRGMALVVVLTAAGTFGFLDGVQLLRLAPQQNTALYQPTVVDARLPIYETMLAEIDSGFVQEMGWSRYYVIYRSAQAEIQDGLYPLGRPDLDQPFVPDYAITASPDETLQPPAGHSWELLHEDATGRIFRRVP